MKIRIQVSRDYQVYEVEQEVPEGVKVSVVSAQLREFANKELDLLVGPKKETKTFSAKPNKVKFADLMLSEAQIKRLTQTQGYTEADLKGVGYDGLDKFMTVKKSVKQTTDTPWEVEL